MYAATEIDPWFLDQIVLVNEVAGEVAAAGELTRPCCAAKRHGLSDAQIAPLRGIERGRRSAARHALGIRPVFKTVDTCAAEFAASTPYHYSSYDEETEVAPARPARP